MAISVRRYSTDSSLDLLHSSSFQYSLPLRTLSVRYSLHLLRLLLFTPSLFLTVFVVVVVVVRYEQFKNQGKLLEGDDLDFAFDSISAFSDTTDNQEALFGPHEPFNLKDIKFVCFLLNSFQFFIYFCFRFFLLMLSLMHLDKVL